MDVTFSLNHTTLPNADCFIEGPIGTFGHYVAHFGIKGSVTIPAPPSGFVWTSGGPLTITGTYVPGVPPLGNIPWLGSTLAASDGVNGFYVNDPPDAILSTNFTFVVNTSIGVTENGGETLVGSYIDTDQYGSPTAYIWFFYDIDTTDPALLTYPLYSNLAVTLTLTATPTGGGGGETTTTGAAFFADMSPGGTICCTYASATDSCTDNTGASVPLYSSFVAFHAAPKNYIGNSTVGWEKVEVLSPYMWQFVQGGPNPCPGGATPYVLVVEGTGIVPFLYYLPTGALWSDGSQLLVIGQCGGLRCGTPWGDLPFTPPMSPYFYGRSIAGTKAPMLAYNEMPQPGDWLEQTILGDPGGVPSPGTPAGYAEGFKIAFGSRSMWQLTHYPLSTTVAARAAEASLLYTQDAVTGAVASICGQCLPESVNIDNFMVGAYTGAQYGVLYGNGDERKNDRVYWKTTNSARDWDDTPGTLTTLQGNVCALVVTGEHTLVGLIWDNAAGGGTGANLFYSVRSYDGGKTWESDTDPIDAIPALAVYPPQLLAHEHRVYAVWVDVDGDGNANPVFAATTDAGHTWE